MPIITACLLEYAYLSSQHAYLNMYTHHHSMPTWTCIPIITACLLEHAYLSSQHAYLNMYTRHHSMPTWTCIPIITVCLLEYVYASSQHAYFNMYTHPHSMPTWTYIYASKYMISYIICHIIPQWFLLIILHWRIFDWFLYWIPRK